MIKNNQIVDFHLISFSKMELQNKTNYPPYVKFWPSKDSIIGFYGVDFNSLQIEVLNFFQIKNKSFSTGSQNDSKVIISK
jgi:hypothetical protein